ncbi:MAG TPA: hypothetical protein VI911_10680 [Patescibacteria group bacterium]|nr:hypothetical protein [Patescibacteria group bacterium]
MGGGSYSSLSRTVRATSLGYDTKSAREIFTAATINSAMNPYGVQLREARDSIEHPESFAIILALDLTGSMGSVPHYLVREGLPKIMQTIIDGGILHPQLLFLGVGDHECDRAPLQVGQFESSDALLDKWLTDVYLEGGGGGNAGESYHLAWYFASKHTAIDCFEKRAKKGILFTIGDEPVLSNLSKDVIKKIMGDGQYEDYTAAQLLATAREKYNVYHIHNEDSRSGRGVAESWRVLMGNDNVLIAPRHQNIVGLISRTTIAVAQESAMPINITATM